MNEISEALMDCYLSGQMSEGEWQCHLRADPSLAGLAARDETAALQRDLRAQVARLEAKISALKAAIEVLA